MTNHPNRSRRARFIVSGNEVTLVTPDGESTTYFVPWTERGGYVRIRDAQGRFPQVCEGLQQWGGPTLWASTDTLATVIRREYRVARKALGY